MDEQKHKTELKDDGLHRSSRCTEVDTRPLHVTFKNDTPSASGRVDIYMRVCVGRKTLDGRKAWIWERTRHLSFFN